MATLFAVNCGRAIFGFAEAALGHGGYFSTARKCETISCLGCLCCFVPCRPSLLHSGRVGREFCCLFVFNLLGLSFGATFGQGCTNVGPASLRQYALWFTLHL
jgi:hypothetical protein